MLRWLIVLAVIVATVVGFLFIKGPSPAIIVAPEHIFDIGPLEVTNTMFTSWIVVILLSAVAIFAGRSMSVVPSGFSGAVEAFVSGFYGIVTNIAGEENGRRFFWVVATIFFYVLASNYFGLLPINNVIGKPEAGHGEKQAVFQQREVLGMKLAYIPTNPDEIEVAPHEPAAEEGAEEATAEDHGPTTSGETKGTAGEVDAHPTEGADEAEDVAAEPIREENRFSGLLAPYFRSVNTDVNTPLALAIFSFIFVEFWGLSTLGPGYLTKFFNFSIFRARSVGGIFRGVIDFFVGILEFISELSRMVSFTFRLFGNIFAGEVVLLMIVVLVPLMLVEIFYALELLVGAIQAFVFAMLTLVFAQMAVAGHGDHGEHGEEEHGASH